MNHEYPWDSDTLTEKQRLDCLSITVKELSKEVGLTKKGTIELLLQTYVTMPPKLRKDLEKLYSHRLNSK